MTSRRLSPALAAALIAVGGCASSPVDISTSSDETTPNSVTLKTTSFATSGSGVETLSIGATLRNGTTTELRRFGCVWPKLAIDSATATGGWVELPFTQQHEAQALCVSPYYIVAAGTSQSFETGFVRTSPATKFPRGVALRLRLVGPTPESGPTAPIILAP